jgi:hypothetical protein
MINKPDESEFKVKASKMLDLLAEADHVCAFCKEQWLTIMQLIVGRGEDDEYTVVAKHMFGMIHIENIIRNKSVNE